MVHVDRVGNIAAMVQSNLNGLVASGGSELDGELLAVGGQSLGAQCNGGGPLVCVVAGEIRWRIDFNTVLGHVIFGRSLVGDGLEERHLDRVGSGNHEGAVQEEQSNRVVEARDVGCRACVPALTKRLGRVVDQHFQGRILSYAEALSSEIATVDPDHGAVREQRAFYHSTTFGHAIHFPFRRCGQRLDASTRRVGWGSNVLVRATTADDHIWCVAICAAKREKDRTTGVGIGASVSRKVRESFDSLPSIYVENLSRFRNEHKEVAVVEKVEERIHVNRHILVQDVHGGGSSH